MLGYGVDSSHKSTWDLLFDPRTGLIVTGAMLGATAALYVTSVALHAASFSEVEGLPGAYHLSESGAKMLSGSTVTLGASLLLALPAGVSTGVYLSRFLRDRSRLRRSSAGIPRPVGVVLAPAISEEAYGLYAAGRF